MPRIQASLKFETWVGYQTLVKEPLGGKYVGGNTRTRILSKMPVIGLRTLETAGRKSEKVEVVDA